MNYLLNYKYQQEYQIQTRNRNKLKSMLIRQYFNKVVVNDIRKIELKIEIKDIIPLKKLQLDKKIYRKYFIVLKDGETIHKNKINYSQKEFVKELIAHLYHNI
jgi:hypothetical protein